MGLPQYDRTNIRFGDSQPVFDSSRYLNFASTLVPLLLMIKAKCANLVFF